MKINEINYFISSSIGGNTLYVSNIGTSMAVLKTLKILSCLYARHVLMPRSHIHGSPRRFYYGFNLTDDPGYTKIRSPIRMHYIRMIKYYYVGLRMQYGKLRTNTVCHECTVRECVTWA